MTLAATSGRSTGQREEALLRAAGIRARRRRAAAIAAVRLQFPRGRIGQLALEDAVEPGAARRIEHGRDHLHPLPQITRPPVGGADVILGIVLIDEMVYQIVLETLPHYTD